jgi:hypothetical protein
VTAAQYVSLEGLLVVVLLVVLILFIVRRL